MEATELLRHVERLGGIERDEEVDAALQLLWDGDDTNSFGIEIGNEYHEKPAPFTDDLSCAMALAVRLFDNGFVDIEAAYRSVNGVPAGRAEICGPHIDVHATGPTPTVALLLAIVRALPPAVDSGEE